MRTHPVIFHSIHCCVVPRRCNWVWVSASTEDPNITEGVTTHEHERRRSWTASILPSQCQCSTKISTSKSITSFRHFFIDSTKWERMLFVHCGTQRTLLGQQCNRIASSWNACQQRPSNPWRVYLLESSTWRSSEILYVIHKGLMWLLQQVY